MAVTSIGMKKIIAIFSVHSAITHDLQHEDKQTLFLLRLTNIYLLHGNSLCK